MRSIILLLILVMIGLNGKGQSVTALPDSVLSQCCLEVTLLNGNVTTVDWVFIQYITRDGTGTKLFVEYAPNFGGIQWETQIRIQDDFDEVLERSKFIMLPFTVGSTDYAINRNWIANIEENTTTGGTWIYGRFGTPTKRKFSAVEDYETMKNLLLACRPRAIVVAENGLYTEGDTVRMGGFLIENTTITTEGYNWQMKDTLSKTEFGIDYSSVFGDTVSYMARRWGKWRNTMHVGRRYFMSYSLDTTGVTGIESIIEHSYFAGTDDPYVKISTQSGSGSTLILNRFQVDNYQGAWSYEDNNTNPYYSHGVLLTSTTAQLGSGESGTGDPGNGVAIGTYGFGIGADEYVFLRTKGIDNSTATVGQFLQLQNATSGKSEWATIDLSAYLPIADTAAMLLNYPSTAGYGIIDAGKTWRADTTSPNGLATRLFAKTLPTSIAANYAAVSDGTNLIARNLFDNNTYVGILNSKPLVFGSQSVAGLPTGVDGYWLDVSNYKWIARYNSTAGSWIYPLQSSLTGGIGTAGSLLFLDANGRATQDNANLFWNNSTKRLGIGTTSPSQALEIYTPTTTLIDLLKVQTANCANCNIKLSMNGFEGIVSSALLRLKSLGTNTPFIYFGNGGVIDMGFETAASTNKVNVNSALNLSGKFGFTWNPGTTRVHEAIKHETTYNTNEAGISFATYGVLNNLSNVNKGQVQFKMAPSKENWVGDGTVNTNYNFYVTQPGSGYGSISTVSGNNTITCPNSAYSLFTKDFNIGTSITLNSTTFTITGITNDYTATVTPTPGFTGTYDYTINNSAPIRFGVYKNGGVEINQATGQTRYELTVNGTNAIGFPRGNTATRPPIISGTTPLRYNTDLAILEYGTFPSTWTPITLGSVTSVGLSLPSIFSVSGSPVTTSGTLSATFTGGSAGQFLRGDGRWTKSLYFNSEDSIQFNTTDPYFGGTALMSLKGNDAGFDSRFNIADYGYVNQALAITTGDDARYIFDRARGTIASPTALLKDDRIGGIYFNAHNGTSYRKTGYIGAVVDSIHSGANPQSKLIFGTSEVNSPETSSYWRFLIEATRNLSVVDHVIGRNFGVGFGASITVLEAATVDARLHVKGTGTTTDKTMLLEDSGGADILTITDNKTIQTHGYGAGNKEAADLSKTQSAYIAGFATDGTLLDYPLSSLGNGIYGGSGTLSQHTTRARIPDDGNFLISQLFNSDADSAYIQVINGLDGNREVRLGVTDTMSTGFATLVLKQDADNEVMSWQLRSSDNEGQTVLEGDGGNISASVDEGYEFQISGMVSAKREAYSEITSTSSPQTLSNTYSDNLINQGGTQATFTLNMPPSPEDGQICTLTYNNAISVLTLDGNGETIIGTAVTTAVAGSQRKFKFYSGIGWIKIY